MTVGMINANPVVHQRPERAAHPAHAALDALDVFGNGRARIPRLPSLVFSYIDWLSFTDWRGTDLGVCRYRAGHQGPGAPLLAGADTVCAPPGVCLRLPVLRLRLHIRHVYLQ